MREYDIVLNPGDDVILKSTLDDLMKEIRRYEFVNVGSREILGERL